ncbi:uncharacterized protein LOC108742534 [Agrilus planipennis]|uniref:Uncharacterized protein LOC108742534 n=1 Tax=Agrilus planipennis TaxID=224129 RepID=A0A1W4XLL7_AGRPL|nr:uncharacterized protein LOC108742534 [Agrilus planipennis]
MSGAKSKLKWVPVKPIRRSDNIISSEARASGYTGFQTSYDKEPVHFPFLMSNEYMRKWFNERDVYANDRYASILTEKETAMLKRRYVLRDMTKVNFNRMRDFPSKQKNRFSLSKKSNSNTATKQELNHTSD